MSKVEDYINIIYKIIISQLNIRTDIAYPKQLIEDGQRTCENEVIFESLIPGIVNRMVETIYHELFDSLTGTPRMQAVRLQKTMEKHYAPLLPILGEKRFKKYLDFTSKVDGWKTKKLSEPEIQELLIKSATAMYWSAARRNPHIFEQDILGNFRNIVNQLPEISSKLEANELSILEIDESLQKTLISIDLYRAPTEVKNLLHDLLVYAGIFYFINKLNPEVHVREALEDKDRLGSMDAIRDIINQIAKTLVCNQYFKNRFLTDMNLKTKGVEFEEKKDDAGKWDSPEWKDWNLQ